MAKVYFRIITYCFRKLLKLLFTVCTCSEHSKWLSNETLLVPIAGMVNLSKLDQEIPLWRLKAIQLFCYLVIFAFCWFNFGNFVSKYFRMLFLFAIFVQSKQRKTPTQFHKIFKQISCLIFSKLFNLGKFSVMSSSRGNSK